MRSACQLQCPLSFHRLLAGAGGLIGQAGHKAGPLITVKAMADLPIEQHPQLLVLQRDGGDHPTEPLNTPAVPLS
jgi:hypothetical protein